METEAKSIRLQIDADPRLAAAVGGVARYVADSAGMEGDAVTQLQKAVIAACTEAFEYITKNRPHLTVTLTRLPDRIEVEVAHDGNNPPALGLDTIVKSASQEGVSGGGLLSGVDRIQYEAQGDVTVTRLTKYIRQGIPSR